jgi:hypothetical protein
VSSKSACGPAGLGAAGRKLWREVADDFELEADGVRLLAEVCRSVDELDRLSKAFAEAEVMTTGSAVSRLPIRYSVRSGRTG